MVDLASKSVVDGLVCDPSKTMQFFADDVVKSFFVRKPRKGRPYFVLKYHPVGGGAQKTLVIGPADDWFKMTGHQAREIARLWRVEVDEGRDPAVLHFKPKDAISINEMLDFHDSHHQINLRSKKKGSHYIVKRFREVYGNHRATSVTRQMIKDFCLTQYGDKLGMISVLTDHIRGAYYKAMDPDDGIGKWPPGFVNPARVFHKAIPALKTYHPAGYAVAWSPDEWLRVGRGFEYVETLNPMARLGFLALKLLMLTGARPSEIERLRTDEIEQQTIHYDDGRVETHTVIIKERHKMWYTTGRPRRILVFENGEAVLAQAKALRDAWGYDGKLVFPTVGERYRFTRNLLIQSYIKDFRKITGMPTLKPYNFRSAYISLAIDHLTLGRIDEIAENCGHKDTATTLRYYRRTRDPKKFEAGKRVDDVFSSLWGSQPVLRLVA